MAQKPKQGFPIEFPITSVVFCIYPPSPERLREAGILKLRINIDPKAGKELIGVDEEGNVADISSWWDEGLKAMFAVTYWWKGEKKPPEEVIARYFTKIFKGVWKEAWGDVEEVSKGNVEVQRGRRGFRVTIHVPSSVEWIKNLRDFVKKNGEKRPYGQHVLFAPGEYELWLPVLHRYIRSKGMEIEEELMTDLARHAKDEKELIWIAGLLTARLDLLANTLKHIEKSLKKVKEKPSSHTLEALKSEVERLQELLNKVRGSRRKEASIKHHIWYLNALLRGASKIENPKKVINNHLTRIQNDIRALQQAKDVLLDIQRFDREKIKKVWRIRERLGLDDPYNFANLSRRLKEPSGQQALRSL